MDGDAELLGDGAANGLDDVVLVASGIEAAFDFVDEGELFATAGFDLNGDGGAAIRTQERVTALGGPFDVLGVVVLAAHDDDVFEAAGDEEFVVVQKAEVAAAQEGAGVRAGEAGVKSGGGFGGAVPVAGGDAAAGDPDFADGAGRARLVGFWINDDDLHLLDERAAAGDLQGVWRLAENDLAAAEGGGIHGQHAHGAGGGANGDGKGGFGHAVGETEGGGIEAERGIGLGETNLGLPADRLGAAKNVAPGVQVEGQVLFLGGLVGEQFIGEVGGAGVGAAVAADGLQPAQGAFEEDCGGHLVAEAAGKEGLQKAVDEAKVVVVGKPGDGDTVGGIGDCMFVAAALAPEIVVGHHDAFGGGCGAGGVLEIGDGGGVSGG